VSTKLCDHFTNRIANGTIVRAVNGISGDDNIVYSATPFTPTFPGGRSELLINSYGV